jgi:ribonuclease M5
MKRVKEAIVVEGRYDKNALSQVVDAVILETSGFGVFKDSEKVALLRALAEKQGLIVFTDPDGAGFVIRNFLKGAIPKEQVKHAYIPDIYGKERRKRAPGKEGKLGVEGVSPQMLLDALTRAGATFLDEESSDTPRKTWTTADLYAMGLTGQPDSARRRKELLAKLGLPEHMSTKALLAVLDALYTREEIEEAL